MADPPGSLNQLLTILECAAALAGLYLAVLYFRRRPKPTLSVLHGFTGFFALSLIVVMLRGLPGTEGHPSRPGQIAAALLTWSLFSGLMGPLYRETNPPARLAWLLSHFAAGAAGFVVVMLVVTGKG
jgi:hypothetical protein